MTLYRLHASGSWNNFTGQDFQFKISIFDQKDYENSLEDFWPYWNMYKTKSTPYRLHVNGCPEDAISNSDSVLAELIFWVEIFNL